MIHFTSYAEKKFEVLNRHKVFFTREQIEDVINTPEKVNKKGKYYFSQKDGIRAVYKTDADTIKVITFYPKAE